jgi:hypothetical protein
MPAGGHFAALEQPQLLQDVRDFFGSPTPDRIPVCTRELLLGREGFGGEAFA